MHSSSNSSSAYNSYTDFKHQHSMRNKLSISRTLSATAIGLASLLFSGCSTTESYESEASPKLAPEKYTTFTILEVKPGAGDVGEDAAKAIRLGPTIEESIKAMLLVKNYVYVEEGEADLTFKVVAAFDTVVEVSEWGSTEAIYPAYKDHGWITNYARRTIDVDLHKAGSVAVEAYDSKTREIIWVGWRDLKDKEKPTFGEVIDLFQNIMLNFPGK